MLLAPSLLWGFGLYFVLFSIYIEINPDLTNIWYRINSEGVREINVSSYWNFISHPFYDADFWYPSNWDVNYFVGAGITTALLYCFW